MTTYEAIGEHWSDIATIAQLRGAMSLAARESGVPAFRESMETAVKDLREREAEISGYIGRSRKRFAEWRNTTLAQCCALARKHNVPGF